MGTRRVVRDGEDVHLTKTEWSLLEAFTAASGKLLTHRWLLENVWGGGYEDDVEVLRVFVSQLRKKIEPDPHRPGAIVTEPGVGYRWSLVRGRAMIAGVPHRLGSWARCSRSALKVVRRRRRRRGALPRRHPRSGGWSDRAAEGAGASGSVGADQRDLGRFVLEPRHVASEAPLDVPIVALLDVQGDPGEISERDPLVDQHVGAVGIARRVHRSHFERLDPAGVPSGLEDRAIEVLDQDQRDVTPARGELHPMVMGFGSQASRRARGR